MLRTLILFATAPYSAWPTTALKHLATLAELAGPLRPKVAEVVGADPLVIAVATGGNYPSLDSVEEGI